MQLRDSSRGYSPVYPKDSTIFCASVTVAQAGEVSFVLKLLCVKDQDNGNWAQVRHLTLFLIGYEGDSLACFSHCFFLPSFSSFLHLCHYLQSIGQVIIFSFLKGVLETVYLRLGLKPTWQGFCAVLSHSVMSDQDLGLAKTHSAWF